MVSPVYIFSSLQKITRSKLKLGLKVNLVISFKVNNKDIGTFIVNFEHLTA